MFGRQKEKKMILMLMRLGQHLEKIGGIDDATREGRVWATRSSRKWC